MRLRYPLHYDAIVRGHARNYRLDPALLAAVIYQECKFHVHARSSSGAIGLMQLLPATAKGIAMHTGGTRFRSPTSTTRRSTSATAPGTCATCSTSTTTSELALAAYNAGQDNVDRWRAEGRGIAFAETRHYVKRVEHLRTLYRKAYHARLYGSS